MTDLKDLIRGIVTREGGSVGSTLVFHEVIRRTGSEASLHSWNEWIAQTQIPVVKFQAFGGGGGTLSVVKEAQP